MAENDFEQKMSAFFKNPLIKVIILGFLVFMLMIPVALIDGVISERRYSRDEVVAGGNRKLGIQPEPDRPLDCSAL